MQQRIWIHRQDKLGTGVTTKENKAYTMHQVRKLGEMGITPMRVQITLKAQSNSD